MIVSFANKETDGLPPIHPGVFLKEILDELGISLNAFAKVIGVSPMRVSKSPKIRLTAAHFRKYTIPLSY